MHNKVNDYRYIEKPKQFLFLLLLIILIASSCRATPQYYLRKNYTPKVFIEELNSSEQKPVELCGELDLHFFLDAIYCGNQNKFYESTEEAFSHLDETFQGTSEKGYKVMKFDGACYKQLFDLFITIDACKEL